MCGDYGRGVAVRFYTTELQYQLSWVLHYVCSSTVKTFTPHAPFNSYSGTYNDCAKLATLNFNLGTSKSIMTLGKIHLLMKMTQHDQKHNRSIV